MLDAGGRQCRTAAGLKTAAATRTPSAQRAGAALGALRQRDPRRQVRGASKQSSRPRTLRRRPAKSVAAASSAWPTLVAELQDGLVSTLGGLRETASFDRRGEERRRPSSPPPRSRPRRRSRRPRARSRGRRQRRGPGGGERGAPGLGERDQRLAQGHGRARPGELGRGRGGRRDDRADGQGHRQPCRPTPRLVGERVARVADDDRRDRPGRSARCRAKSARDRRARRRSGSDRRGDGALARATWPSNAKHLESGRGVRRSSNVNELAASVEEVAATAEKNGGDRRQQRRPESSSWRARRGDGPERRAAQRALGERRQRGVPARRPRPRASSSIGQQARQTADRVTEVARSGGASVTESIAGLRSRSARRCSKRRR